MELDDEETAHLESLIHLAQEKLSDFFNTKISLTIETYFRKTNVRCKIICNANNVPKTVIVKQPASWKNKSYNITDLTKYSMASRLLNEVSSLSLINSTEKKVAPELILFDWENGLIIQEDMGDQSMVEFLLEGNASGARKTLVNYSTLLGKFHSSTIGRYEEFSTIRKNIIGNDVDTNDSYEGITDKIKQIFELTNIPLSKAFFKELREIYDEILNSKKYHVLVHMDPCPDNIIRTTDGDLILIDFETSKYGYAFLDAVYGHLSFPTCWCANKLDRKTVEEMDKAYRKEFGKVCPEILDDDVYFKAILNACIFWLFRRTLSFFLKDFLLDENKISEDNQWGISGIKQRVILRLGSVIELHKKTGLYPAVQNIFQQLLDKFHDLWEEIEPMPVFPPFMDISKKY